MLLGNETYAFNIQNLCFHKRKYQKTKAQEYNTKS